MRRVLLIGLSLMTLVACQQPIRETQPSQVVPPANLVDTFHVDHDQVKVYFFDPLLAVIEANPGFSKLAPRTQADRYYDYLHGHAVYLFRVTDEKGKPKKDLILRGNPEVTNSAAFYQLETVDLTSYILPSPNSAEYYSKAAVVSRQKLSTVRGSLFEHMEIFHTDLGREITGGKLGQVGLGVSIFKGIYARVVAYSEVKDAIMPHLSEQLVFDRT